MKQRKGDPIAIEITLQILCVFTLQPQLREMVGKKGGKGSVYKISISDSALSAFWKPVSTLNSSSRTRLFLRLSPVSAACFWSEKKLTDKKAFASRLFEGKQCLSLSQHIAAHQLLLGLASAKVWPFFWLSSQPLNSLFAGAWAIPSSGLSQEGTKAGAIPTVRQINYDL